jgi:hypothetical protein
VVDVGIIWGHTPVAFATLLIANDLLLNLGATNMKKKLLPVAVLSALAGVNVAQAVTVNPDGLGQVLLYPFYTTEGGQDTTISLVNTTADYKAVKVRILESMNSQEVLDFNLYLSPFDHWSAVISADANGPGATITSGDNSCTVPNAISDGETIPFRNFEYLTDAINTGLERTKEGYVEVIEMGNLNNVTTAENALRVAIKHVNGVPGNCAAVSAAWNTGGTFETGTTMLLPPTGGVYGYGVLIDVAEGTDATYDAVALQNYSSIALHTNPGSLDPSLAAADPTAAAFDSASGAVLDLTPTSGLGIDAVSAVLMSKNVANDYVLEPSIAAGTDWVITFPTKRDYVNIADPNTPVTPPFTQKWNRLTTTACEAIAITYYDREEQGVQPDDLDFSPAPPGPAAFALCAEANVLTFNSSNVLEASARSGADLALIHDNGWLAIDYQANAAQTAADPNARLLATAAGNMVGLPSVGFAVQKYVNGDLGGLLSNYAGSVVHKKAVSIQ